uniref:Uncharacterized protein n=1 Tax=Arundo donax TaxID=35708 RepID=A0A0A9F8H8_ARUDO
MRGLAVWPNGLFQLGEALLVFVVGVVVGVEMERRRP